jgi:hypothetical protein
MNLLFLDRALNRLDHISVNMYRPVLIGEGYSTPKLWRFKMVRSLVILILVAASFHALAEGGCPPGQYPIGGQGVQGCAPIPGASGGTSTSAPKPTGKWETRWGAVVEDSSTLATGISVSQKSKREATSVAMKDCEQAGGRSCKLRVAYYNQCVAIADPTIASRQRTAGNSESRHVAAETLELATAGAMKDCAAFETGQECSIVYSACSMSEFKPFR